MARRLRRTLGHLAPNACSPDQGQPIEPNMPIPTDDRPAGHRLGRLPIVRATPCGPGGELSAAQVEAYCRDGFLFVSGLVPKDIAAAAAEGMWAQMAAENRDCQPVGAGRDNVRNIDDRGRPTSATWMNRRDVPASWTGDGDYPVKDNARVMAIYTPQWLRAAQQLADAHAARSIYPVAQRPKVSRPTGGLAINRFPRHEVGPYPPEVGGQHPDKLLDGYQPHSDYVRSPILFLPDSSSDDSAAWGRAGGRTVRSATPRSGAACGSPSTSSIFAICRARAEPAGPGRKDGCFHDLLNRACLANLQGINFVGLSGRGATVRWRRRTWTTLRRDGWGPSPTRTCQTPRPWRRTTA